MRTNVRNLAHRLLLIEDDAEFADIFKKWIGPHFQVTVASTFRDAKERLMVATKEPWDCIVLDMRLPNGEGVELISSIEAVAPQIPIVVFTGAFPKELWQDALLAGAQEFLVKGETTRDQLLRTISRAIVRHQVRKEFRKLENTAQEVKKKNDMAVVAVEQLKNAVLR